MFADIFRRLRLNGPRLCLRSAGPVAALTLAALAYSSGDALAQPVISSVTPSSVTYGITPNTSVTILGSGFQLGATITVGSLTGTTVAGSTATAATPFVFVAANAVRFYWPNTALPPGTYDVVVTNPDSQTTTPPGTFTVNAPSPTVTDVTPPSGTYGITPSQSITISGTNFVLGATITVGSLSGPTVAGSVASAAVPYVWVNSNTLRFWWPNTALTPASYAVQVTNPPPAGGLAASLAAGFAVNAPQPTVTSTLPNPVTYGIFPSQSITISGTNFVLGATIAVGSLSGPTAAGSVASAAVPFVFVSSSTVRFWWPNTSLAPASYDVQVTNPTAAGGLSATLAGGFAVSGSQPAVSALTPSQVTYGGTSLPITVSGSGFILGARIDLVGPGSDPTVRLTGTTVTGTTASASQPFVFASSTRLSFYWDSAAEPPLPIGSYTVTVTNPAAAGGLSSVPLANAFEVLAAVPTITATLPTQVTYDILLSRAITITGANFVEGATILIDSPDTTTCLPANCSASPPTVLGTAATPATPFVFIRGTQLSFYWPNTALTPGVYQVIVRNPPEAGGQSAPVPGVFTVAAPVPQITSVTPSSVEYNVTPSTNVRITGVNFYQPPAGAPSSDPSFVTVGSLQIPCVLGTGPATAATPCVHIDRRNIEFYWLQTSNTSDPLHLAPGAHAVQVTNPAYAGAASNTPPLANGFTVTAPQPQIQAVRPRAVTAGITPSRAVDIVGVDNAAQHLAFVAGAAIRVEDPSLPASQNLVCTAVSGAGQVPSAGVPCVYVGAGLLRFYWDTDDAADSGNPVLGPGTYSITVANPADRGGLLTTEVGAFRVTSLPELVSVEPATGERGVGSGARSAVINLTTAGFSAGSVVRIGAGQGDPQITMRSGFRAFASGDGGTVAIDVAEDPAQTADRELAVTITSADGLYTFTCPDTTSTQTCQSGLIITPGPVVTTITPGLDVATGSGTLTITGDRFVVPGTTVTLPAGVSGTCTATSTTTIDCANVIVAASVAPGSATVIVTNPDGGRTTGIFTVSAPPVISLVTPNSGAAGATVPVRITGSGFQTGIRLAFGTGSGIDVSNVTFVNAGTVDATFVAAAGAADGYRALTATNPDGRVAIAPQAFYIGTPPSDTLRALATFGEQGQSLVQSQRSLGTGWSARFAGPVLSSVPVWQVMKASPIRDERILGVVDDQRRVALHVWNGQTWIGAINAATASGLARPSQTVDVAFEQQSGRGVAVYAGADTTLRYRVWNGSAWSAEGLVEDAVNGQPTGGRPLWVRLAARPGTNDLVLAYQDSNDDVAALVWNGTTQQWGNAVLLTASAPGHDAPLVDVAFERLTGRALVVWATAEAPAGHPRYRLWNSGWGPEATASLGAGADANPLAALRVVGDHGTNRVALGTSDGSTLVVQLWDGPQWAAGTSLTTEAAGEGRGRAFDLAWEGVSGDLVAVYGTRSSAGGAWRTWSSAGGWSAPSSLPAAAGETVLSATLSRAANSADATLVLLGATNFPASGVVRIDTELIRYTSTSTVTSGSTTTTSLAGVTRGEFGTTAASHTSGATVQVVPYSAWIEVAAARGIDELALASFDTQSRVTLRRWTGAGWVSTLEAQPLGAGLVSTFDPAIGRTSLLAGRTIAITLAQHLTGPGPGISPPPVTVDTTAPAAPILSTGTATATSVPLSWIAVGDDGAGGGMVARYELRRTATGSSGVQNVTPTQSPGGTENATASGLSGGTVYTFDIRALDEAGNASAWSTPVTVTTAVDQPPPAVNLSLASPATASAVTIQWALPVDDSGPIAGYQVRYTTAPTFAFDTATPYTLHLPTVVGSTATLTIDGLIPDTTYRIGVKAMDAMGQIGTLSNVLPTTTAPGDSADVTPPAAVTDLAVFPGATTNTSLLLQWTATGDPVGGGNFERASAYEVRYATIPLVAGNFSQGTLIGSIPPGLPGATQELSVGGLTSNTTYYLGLRVIDDGGNFSPLSNVVVARTALRRGYTLVSVPLLLPSPNNTPDAVFGDDVGLPPYAYRWLSSGPTVADGCYAGTVSQIAFPTCASLSSIETGSSYYLYAAGTRAVLDATGSSVTAGTFEVALVEGFNMVGNPYGEPISLADVRVKLASDPSNEVSYAAAVAQGWVAGAMYLYDGVVHQAYAPGDSGAVFHPWNGAWIQSRMADAVLVFDAP